MHLRLSGAHVHGIWREHVSISSQLRLNKATIHNNQISSPCGNSGIMGALYSRFVNDYEDCDVYTMPMPVRGITFERS